MVENRAHDVDGFKKKVEIYLTSYDGFRANDDEIVAFLETLCESVSLIAGKRCAHEEKDAHVEKSRLPPRSK